MNANVNPSTLSFAGRKGDWIQTHTGIRFYPLDPRPEEIFIEDIAGSLSKMCRFAGHCVRFYSVAEHCVHVASYASQKNKLGALLHDASEAYLVDVPRPLKPSLVGYYEHEDRLMSVIAARYGFTWPMPDEVKRLDAAILHDERVQNMVPRPESGEEWGDYVPGLGVKLRYWSPARAYQKFMQTFNELGGK